MTAQRGRDLLLKIVADGTPTTVAGLRATRLAFDAAMVETTDSRSPGMWRELLAGSGLRRASIAGEGLFRDAASDALVRAAFFAGAHPAWQIVMPGFGVIDGAFQIVRLDYAGRFRGELEFSAALESAGAIAFRPL